MSRRCAPWAAAIALLTVAAALLFGGAAVNYDTQWALTWGQALAHGDQPDIDINAAPTSKPLVTAFIAVVQPIAGDATPGVLHALAFVAFAALVVLAFAVATTLSGRVAGLVAAGMMAISSPVHLNTAVAFQDVATAALLLLAVLLELQRRRRGTAPLLVLAVAGLMRPEAWGLAAAYWLWCALDTSSRERVRLAALAALGPALWLGFDLVFSGDPLLSFNRTREGAAAAKRVTGLEHALTQLDANLRLTIRAAGVGAALLGSAIVAAALVWRRRPPAALRVLLAATDRRLGIVLALAVLLTVAFFAIASGELSLLDRYTIPLSAALAVLAGHAAGGWLGAERGTARWVWAAAGGLIVVALAITVTDQRDITRGGLRFGENHKRLANSLEDLVASPAGRQALDGCARDTIGGYRMVPIVAYELDRAPRFFPLANDPPARDSSAWIAPTSERAFADYGPVDGKLGRPPAGFTRAAANADFAIFTRGCRGGPAARAGLSAPAHASRRSSPSAPAAG